MSIIIRLQNLPLNAKSGDIRQFFGGLYIPDGGVHILGGEKGDAFIAFMTDDDARLAMRKDGGKIKDTHIKLFLSSRMEMQYEVEKKTKRNFDDVSSYKMLSSIHASEVEVIRSRSSERKRLSCNQSPYMMNSEWENDKSKPLNDYQEMSKPIIEERIISSRGSPKRSRSPKRHLSSQRCPPSKSRTYSQRRRSISPQTSRYTHSEYQIGEQSDSEFQSVTKSQLQAELEKRITEELEKSYIFDMVIGDKKTAECTIPGLNIGVAEDVTCGIQESYSQNDSYKNIQQDLMSFLRSDTHQFQKDKFNFLEDKNQQENLSLRHSEMFISNEADIQQKYGENFCITLSGLDRLWNFREVQMMLKGIFAPQNHIRFERDHSGYKTGVAFVKLTNKEDFDSIIKKQTIVFNGFEITVNVCPDSVSCNYFPSNSYSAKFPESNEFCYTLKGLPFSCTYEDVIKFFHGFEIADLVIFYHTDGKATGTGFVSFTHRKDFEEALSQNGKKILHRYIEMLPCTQKEMAKAKSAHLNDSSFIPYSKILLDRKLPVTRRPLCALLTGLPAGTTTKKIASFFSESGLRPDAIHLTVRRNKMSDGRAFVEFTNFLDFDLALKFHGKQFDSNIICVKQILYDEMVKILDSQKAQHYFQTAPTGPLLNVPEKVPYLWEPPDATEEQDKIKVDNSSSHYKGEFTNDYEGSRLQDKLSPSSYSESSKNYFISSKSNYDDKNFYSHSSRELVSSVKSHSTESDPNGKRGSKALTKEPVRTNIKNNFEVNTKPNDPFISFEKYEDNISKLSAENESTLLKFLNRKIKDRKSISPDKRGRSAYREKSLPKTKDYREDKLHKSRYANDSRYLSERSSRHNTRWNLDHNSRGSFQSVRKEKEDKSKGCIVHLSNVSVSVGTQDLLNFFKGFKFYEDTLIRRYTDEGEPTHDVRVMFCSEREAKEAIRTLNKCFLHNKPVSMVIL